MGENRAKLEVKFQLPITLAEDFRAENIARHEVGRELDAAEVEAQRLRDGADEQGLRQAGHADEQTVSLAEQAEDERVDDGLLPDDGFGEFGSDPRVNVQD